MQRFFRNIIAIVLVIASVIATDALGNSGLLPMLTTSASAASTLTEKDLEAFQKQWKSHPYVLKKFYKHNTSSTGKICVKNLQILLNFVMGEHLSIDAVFGNDTERVVKNFQRKYSLSCDGVVGNGTFNKLISVARSKISNTAPKITIAASFPSKLTYGKAQNILGVISSTGNISSIKAVVTNSQGYALPPVEVKPNSKSYNLKNSDLDFNLPFAKLLEGMYTLKYTVKSGATIAESCYYFKVEKPKQNEIQIDNKANLIPASKIFINQYNRTFKTNYACTLASCGMVLKAKAYLSGKDPANVTLKKLWDKGWSAGCKLDFSVEGMSISAYSVEKDLKCSSKSQKINLLKGLLDAHKEGVVIYAWANGVEHAVYLSHYIGNTFYILDPAGSAKYIPLNQSVRSGLYSDINNIHQIWVSGKLNLK